MSLREPATGASSAGVGDPPGSVLEPQLDPASSAEPSAPGAPPPSTRKLGETLRHDPAARSVATWLLVVLAVFYTLYFARAFILPVVFALLLNFLLAPVIRGMERVRIPPPLGAGIVVLALVGGLAGGGYGLAGPTQGWLARAPSSLSGASAKLRKLRRPVDQVTRSAEQAASTATGAPAPTSRTPAVVVQEGPTIGERLMGTAESVLSGTAEVLILLYFLLASGDLFLQKLIKVLPQFEDKKTAVQIAREVERSVSAYLLTVLVLNASLGLIVMGLMYLLGMPNPVLWGVLAGTLEFMPYVGAACMVGILTLAGLSAFDTVSHALLVPGAYFAVNFLQGNFVSPRILGRRLTLNPVAILIGLALWWLLWGVAGAFLAVPLLATIKIFCDHIETLAPIGEFLGK